MHFLYLLLTLKQDCMFHLQFQLSLNEAKVSLSETDKLVDALVALATKLPDDQSPLSSTREPPPTIDVVSE